MLDLFAIQNPQTHIREIDTLNTTRAPSDLRTRLTIASHTAPTSKYGDLCALLLGNKISVISLRLPERIVPFARLGQIETKLAS